MYSLKKGFVLLTLVGTISTSGVTALAAEEETKQLPMVPVTGVEAVLNKTNIPDESMIEADHTQKEEEENQYSDMAFANVTSYLFVRTEPTKASEWVGKLYPGAAMTVTGEIGEWTPIQSGEVTGYVKTEFLITGKEAQQKAQNIAQEAQNIGNYNSETYFKYAESRAAEEARLQKEAEERAKAMAEEMSKYASQGQAVVDYASQFIGNPYVWGGTSLTNGADCSGFVQSVYAHFGFSLPRTSSAQRSAGREVSYSEAMPGDIVCYNGHVGIYAGNGQIVNAQDPAHGIGLSPATYAPIITVRRMF